MGLKHILASLSLSLTTPICKRGNQLHLAYLISKDQNSNNCLGNCPSGMQSPAKSWDWDLVSTKAIQQTPLPRRILRISRNEGPQYPTDPPQVREQADGTVPGSVPFP